ncbi:MAG: hypothetical protein BJ554DRAFT_6336, partial [Olpidium bornovanus]
PRAPSPSSSSLPPSGRTFVRVHRLEIAHVPDDAVLVADAVAPEHVSSGAGDVERLAARVALHHRDHLRSQAPGVLEPAHLKGGLQGDGDLRLRVGELFLDQLEASERPARAPFRTAFRHPPVERVLPGLRQAKLRGAQRAPGDPVPRVVQAAERALEALDVRQHGVGGNAHVVHHDHAGDARAQRELALDGGSGEAAHALLENKPADCTVLLGHFRPHDEDVGDGRIGDPSFAAVQHEAPV